MSLIFDLDGTLVESAPDIHDALNRCLIDNGCGALSLETAKTYIGNGVPKLVERAMKAAGIEFTRERHADLCNTFSTYYGINPVTLSYLNKGVIPALDQFRDDGFKMAICTNKPIDLTNQVLKGLGIETYFQAVIGGDSLAVKKPDRAPLDKAISLLRSDTCIYIGDSEVDAQTARNAGQPFFLFTDGYRQATIAELKPKAVFNDFAQLPQLINEHTFANTDRS